VRLTRARRHRARRVRHGTHLIPDPGGGSEQHQYPAAAAAVQVHTVVVGGMPGWQIALLAIGAALLAATVAVVADRARAARRETITVAASAMMPGETNYL
jgi:hypothetical protein